MVAWAVNQVMQTDTECRKTYPLGDGQLNVSPSRNSSQEESTQPMTDDQVTSREILDKMDEPPKRREGRREEEEDKSRPMKMAGKTQSSVSLAMA